MDIKKETKTRQKNFYFNNMGEFYGHTNALFKKMITINPLTPKDTYSGHTALLTSKCFILYIYSTNTSTEYFKHGM